MTVPVPAPDVPSGPVGRARELEAADWDAAFDLLHRASRDGGGAEVDIELAQLRHRGWDHLVRRGVDASPAAATSTTPSVGGRGLPEAELGSLEATDIRSAIESHGSMLVPGAIPERDVVRLREVIDEGIAAEQEWSRGLADRRAGKAERWSSPAWYPLQLDEEQAWGLMRRWVHRGGGVLLADSPRALAVVLDCYERLGIRRLVADYLGERPVLSANKCTLRRVEIDAGNGWHQDGAFLGAGIRALNVWVALTDCGVDAPGLDIVPRRFEEIVETGTGTTFFWWGTGDEAVERASGELGVVRPQFRAGDLVFFDDLCLHRTASEPEMTRHRHAIELWSFAATAYPEGHVPLVW